MSHCAGDKPLTGLNLSNSLHTSCLLEVLRLNSYSKQNVLNLNRLTKDVQFQLCQIADRLSLINPTNRCLQFDLDFHLPTNSSRLINILIEDDLYPERALSLNRDGSLDLERTIMRLAWKIDLQPNLFGLKLDLFNAAIEISSLLLLESFFNPDEIEEILEENQELTFPQMVLHEIGLRSWTEINEVSEEDFLNGILDYFTSENCSFYYSTKGLEKAMRLYLRQHPNFSKLRLEQFLAAMSHTFAAECPAQEGAGPFWIAIARILPLDFRDFVNPESTDLIGINGIFDRLRHQTVEEFVTENSSNFWDWVPFIISHVLNEPSTSHQAYQRTISEILEQTYEGLTLLGDGIIQGCMNHNPWPLIRAYQANNANSIDSLEVMLNEIICPTEQDLFACIASMTAALQIVGPCGRLPQVIVRLLTKIERILCGAEDLRLLMEEHILTATATGIDSDAEDFRLILFDSVCQSKCEPDVLQFLWLQMNTEIRQRFHDLILNQVVSSTTIPNRQTDYESSDNTVAEQNMDWSNLVYLIRMYPKFFHLPISFFTSNICLSNLLNSNVEMAEVGWTELLTSERKRCLTREFQHRLTVHKNLFNTIRLSSVGNLTTFMTNAQSLLISNIQSKSFRRNATKIFWSIFKKSFARNTLTDLVLTEDSHQVIQDVLFAVIPLDILIEIVFHWCSQFSRHSKISRLQLENEEFSQGEIFVDLPSNDALLARGQFAHSMMDKMFTDGPQLFPATNSSGELIDGETFETTLMQYVLSKQGWESVLNVIVRNPRGRLSSLVQNQLPKKFRRMTSRHASWFNLEFEAGNGEGRSDELDFCLCDEYFEPVLYHLSEFSPMTPTGRRCDPTLFPTFFRHVSNKSII